MPIFKPDLNVSADVSSDYLSALQFSNLNGVSFGLSGSTITASVNTNYAPAGSGPAEGPLTLGLYASSNTYLTSVGTCEQISLVFRGDKSITVGISSGQVAFSVGAYITTARRSTDGIGLATAKTNAVWTVNSDGFSLDAGGYAGTGFTTTSAAGAVMAGTNDTSGLKLAVPAYLTTAQAPGAYLTTARRSTDALGLGTAKTNVTWTANSDGLSFDAGGYAGTGFTTTTAAGAVIAGTHDTSGLKLAVPSYLTTAQPAGAYLTTARGSTDAVGLNTAQTNVTWTVNSSGLSFNAGGYAGTGTSATNASVTLNSNGLAISVAAAATLVQFEPFPLLNADTTTWVPGIGSWYFQPFVAPQNIAPGRINFLESYSDSNAGILKLTTGGSSFASNTTGTRSAHHVLAETWALYTRGAFPNGSIMSTIWSNTRALSISQSVSISNSSQVKVSIGHTISYIGLIGTDGVVTMTTATASTATSSASVSMATSGASAHMSSLFNLLSGAILNNVGLTKSLTPGNYWLAAAWSTSQTTGGSSIGDLLPFVHEVGLYGFSSAQVYRGWGNTASTSGSNWARGQGVFSAQSNAAPDTVAFTDVRTLASNLYQYFNMMQSSL